MTPATDATVNIDRAAHLSGVSRRVLYYWMSHGKLAYVIVRGSRRVTMQDVWNVKQFSYAGKKEVSHG